MKKQHLFITMLVATGLMAVLSLIGIIPMFNQTRFSYLFFDHIASVLLYTSFVLLTFIIFDKHRDQLMLINIILVLLSLFISIATNLYQVFTFDYMNRFSIYISIAVSTLYKSVPLFITLYYFFDFHKNEITLKDVKDAKERLENELISEAEYNRIVEAYINQD